MVWQHGNTIKKVRLVSSLLDSFYVTHGLYINPHNIVVLLTWSNNIHEVKEINTTYIKCKKAWLKFTLWIIVLQSLVIIFKVHIVMLQ